MLKLRGLKRYLPPSPTPPTLYVLAFEAKDIFWTIYLLFFNNSFCELHGAHFGRVHHQFFVLSPRTAFSPAFSVKTLRWRIRDERAGKGLTSSLGPHDPKRIGRVKGERVVTLLTWEAARDKNVSWLASDYGLIKRKSENLVLLQTILGSCAV